MTTTDKAPAAGSHGGHAHVSRKAEYIRCFWALTILTVAEVGLTFVLKDAALILMLVGAAVAKAGLVAAVFMHLKFEAKTLALIVALPLVFATILIIGLMPDSIEWGLTRMPGKDSFRGN